MMNRLWMPCYRGGRLTLSSVLQELATLPTPPSLVASLSDHQHSPEIRMTVESQAIPTAIPAVRPRQSLLKAHLELGKVRLNAMVVFTTALGFIVGSRSNPDPQIDWGRLFWTCLGTFIAAAGASTFNQAIEARRDARMLRTRNRPLCTGRLTRTYAATLGLILCISGVAILCPTSNGLTAVLAALNVLIYVLFYTPLKPVSSVNTLVGAIVGGIPPVLGWTAATGAITPGALVLGGILFVWQIPHFLALCWIYREDYARGGFKMLPVVERTGRLTSCLALMYSILLVPLCLLVAYFGHAGMIFAAISFVLTMSLIAVALRFAMTRSNQDARTLFFASIIYLPLLAITLMADARTPMDGFEPAMGGLIFQTHDSEPFVDPGSAAGQSLSRVESASQPAPSNVPAIRP
jgi:heme o synthase